MSQQSNKEQMETITKLLGETLQKMGYRLFITSFAIASEEGVIAGVNVSFPSNNPLLLKAMFADLCQATLRGIDAASGQDPFKTDTFNKY